MRNDPDTGRSQPDWLYGTGATPVEKLLVWLTVAVAMPIVAVTQARSDVAWRWWHWLLALALVADLVGGVVANSLGSAKRLYHASGPSFGSLGERVLRSHLAFAALHVHPSVIGLLYPDASWTWATAWYAAAVLGVGIVVTAPTHLKRPAAMGIATLALLVADMVDGPGGVAWVGPTLILKLVVAHAVPEAPYRPAAGT